MSGGEIRVIFSNDVVKRLSPNSVDANVQIIDVCRYLFLNRERYIMDQISILFEHNQFYQGYLSVFGCKDNEFNEAELAHRIKEDLNILKTIIDRESKFIPQVNIKASSGLD